MCLSLSRFKEYVNHLVKAGALRPVTEDQMKRIVQRFKNLDHAQMAITGRTLPMCVSPAVVLAQIFYNESIDLPAKTLTEMFGLKSAGQGLSTISLSRQQSKLRSMLSYCAQQSQVEREHTTEFIYAHVTVLPLQLIDIVCRFSVQQWIFRDLTVAVPK
jgi:hypothetical protein